MNYFVVFLILMGISLWFYLKYFKMNEKDLLQKRKSKIVESKIKELYRSINDICYKCFIYPKYKIVESSNSRYSYKTNNKLTIGIKIWNNKLKRPYNNTDLITWILSEISQMITEDIDNEIEIENILIQKAEELGYINSKMYNQ